MLLAEVGRCIGTAARGASKKCVQRALRTGGAGAPIPKINDAQSGRQYQSSAARPPLYFLILLVWKHSLPENQFDSNMTVMSLHHLQDNITFIQFISS